MADVIVTLKIMPESPETDLDALEKKAKEKLTEKVGESDVKTETEPVAFGLKAMKITFVMSEDLGSPDELEKELSEFDEVNSVEVVDVRRAIG
ncbi:MAG: elongation factor 1-beta [Nanoarchaeota archaeon]